MMQSATKNTQQKELFKKILIPTDFSEASWQAIEHALTIAKAGQTRLIFAHILDAPPINPAIIPDRYIKELQAERIKMVQQKLQEYADYCESEAHANILHKSMVMPGRAASKILQMAQMENVDLIILGSAGASRLMESVSLEVIDKAECPILSIPQRTKSQPFTRLIFLPRSTNQSEETLNYLKQVCASYQLSLNISAPAVGSAKNLLPLHTVGPEALAAIMLDHDPATRVLQKKWIQTLIRDEHMPLFVFQCKSHLNNESQ
ncbi:MAG: universal stress protein [Bacteroidia bacterium]